MKLFINLLICSVLNFTIFTNVEGEDNNRENDHEKAIRAVNEGEILPLDEILEKVQNKFSGRIISINLKDNEKGLFGWVYDIMIIDIENNVKQLRVDAGTSTILSVKSGGDL
tara:strand:- start:624 stop:959 length:336 start_codon:yes stop_codon:yes gene_type:complete